MAKTNEELLDEVETALSSLLSGTSSVRVGQREFNRQSLDQLWKMRDRLLGRINRGARGGMRVRQIVPRG